MKSCAVISTSWSGGEYMMPGLIVNVYVSPSSETVGRSVARSGWSSPPPSSTGTASVDSSVRTRQHRKYSKETW